MKALMILLFSFATMSANADMFPNPRKALSCKASDKNPVKCLVCSIYFESKGHTPAHWADQVETGRSMLTRVLDRNYPNTMCGVVWQGHDRGDRRCQFSWACDGKDDFIPGGRTLRQVVESAKEAVNKGPNGYVNFYANWMTASWAKNCRSRVRKTKHTFCDLGFRYAGPLWVRDVLTNLEQILAVRGETVPVPTFRPTPVQEVIEMAVEEGAPLEEQQAAYLESQMDPEDHEIFDAIHAEK
ncbi:MAG TPA: hypothetical protein DCL41_05895 [Bdellovibrionales bacterium]|mgnify:CR=1 FL=1|nr:hypothetical protein [Pseudobdellovibrionaceae bacterium]HAG91382.1 hypothetical protein [Bdellovibrionales bacterium]|tara:strand:- start:5873 stop:6598 length:726 start_codon:yes stop_codon:yes gene_type:complete